VGVARANSVVDVALLEATIRETLNSVAERRMAVLHPLKVIIENYPEGKTETLMAANHPDFPGMGQRPLTFGREIFVEEEDFLEDPPKKFFRLSPGREVRLRYAYLVTCREVVRDADGTIVALRCVYDPASRGGTAPDGRKVQGTLHWVAAADSVSAEIRLYNHLFVRPDPGVDGSVLADLNPRSVDVIQGCLVEPLAAKPASFDAVQFERQGYFCHDRESRLDRPVFNRTIGLRDTWSKTAAAASRG
jgi:glutaminyl-tRNA synthetase